jgi:hypothetical protein
LRARYAAESGLPCVDPLVDGTGPIVDEILRQFPIVDDAKLQRS